MKIILHNQVDKFLNKQANGDPKGIYQVRMFLASLKNEPNPTALPNCKKMQTSKNEWRWRVGHYRIIGEVRNKELVIIVIKITTRENAY